MAEEVLLYSLAGAIGLYLIVRAVLFFTSYFKTSTETPVEQEINQILTGDDHKVKGRFE